ncbi:aromatic acid exporter family protein [Geodermatophilus sp. SYSU D01186]
MTSLRALLRDSTVQRGIRAAIAAGLAWQVAVLLPAPFPAYAYYAPLGAIIAVHPTIADSASASWRTVLAILLGAGLATGVAALPGHLPTALTLATLVAVAVALERWRVLGEGAGWVSVAAVFTLTIGTSGDASDFVLAYAGLVLLGAAIGVLVTTALFPPLQLTRATAQITRTRHLVAEHLSRTAAELRADRTPTTEDERAHGAALRAALDAMRDAERTVERARRANPRARRWQEPAARIRDESRALDRVAVLLDDVTALVAEYQPHLRGGERPDLGTARRLADALEGLAGVVRTPYHAADAVRPDDRDHRVQVAGEALTALVDRLRATTLDEDPGLLALSAVAVGVERALAALDALPGEEPAD